MLFRLFFFLIFLSSFTQLSAAQDYVYKQLNGPELCEPSSGISVSCPFGRGRCLLVADSQQDKHLYLFRANLSKGDLRFLKTLKFDHLLAHLVDEAVGDIEALARLGRREFLAFGSYSRNDRCQIVDNQRSFFSGRVGRGRISPAQGMARQLLAIKLSCDDLFGFELWKQDAFLARVCEVIHRSEESARRAKYLAVPSEQIKACLVRPAFNVEGAARLRDASGRMRVWIGLRSPLVDGKALLLRQIPGQSLFSFDAAALLDLEGRGVSSLESKQGVLWGIAGNAKSGKAPSWLWKVSGRLLKHGAVIRPVVLRKDLPDGASNIVMAGRRGAFILVKGRSVNTQGKQKCVVSPRYFHLKTR